MTVPVVDPGRHTDATNASVLALRRAFTPSHPLRETSRLAGRKAQLSRILRAILEQSAHVIIYGDRGRGKTSIANLATLSLRAQGVMVAFHTCTAEDDYDSILHGLLRSLPQSLLAAPLQKLDRSSGCDAAFPPGRLQPGDVLGLNGRLTGRQLVLVLDEFDRIADTGTRTRLADTIKLLSDRAAPTLFIVVGVSENLEELLGRHPSIQRNIVGVPLPLLTDAEMKLLLDRGALAAGLVLSSRVREAMVFLARGMPYIAQLLAFHAGYSALTRGGFEISEADLETALSIALAEVDPRVAALYEMLTDGGRDIEMINFLYAIASGPQDGFGRFLVEATGSVVRTAGETARAELWQRLVEAGAVRRVADGGLGLFVMSEATFTNYILMRRICDGSAQRMSSPELNGPDLSRTTDLTPQI